MLDHDIHHDRRTSLQSISSNLEKGLRKHCGTCANSSWNIWIGIHLHNLPRQPNVFTMSLWLKWEEFQSPKRYVKRFQGVSAMPHNRILRLQNVPARSEAACGTTEWRSERLARSMEEQYKISGMLVLLFWRRAAQAYQRVSSSFEKCRIPLTGF